MTRNDFIKNCMALGIGAPFMSMLLSSCGQEDVLFPDFDVNFSGKVLIVGAGAAGLTAGYVLNKYNIDFQILEASSVYGGRIKRDDSFADFPIDLGGEWIHEDPSVLARLISEPSTNADIEILTYNPRTIYNWNDDRLKKKNWATNFYSEYKFKSTTWFGFFEKYIAANIEEKITYDSPVTEIDYAGDKVKIKTSGGATFEADKVLVTVPIKILQGESISFVPELPSAKKNAIDSIEMPDGLKVFIEFSERFYPDILVTGDLLTEVQAADKIFYDAAFGKDSQMNVLGLFTVGEKASAYTDLVTDEAILAAVMSELDTIFDGKATQTYKKHVIQNWSGEPFIQGSYSGVIDGDESTTNLVDGNISTRWSVNEYPQSATVDLGGDIKITQTEVIAYEDRAYQFMIEGALNEDGPYTTIVDRSDNNIPGTANAPIINAVDSIEARYVRITVSGADMYTGSWVSLRELKVFGDGERIVPDTTGLDVEVRISPNPASSFVTIEARDEYDTLEMYDATGKRLVQEPINQVVELDISGLRSGVYMIKVEGDNKSEVCKLIKH